MDIGSQNIIRIFAELQKPNNGYKVNNRLTSYIMKYSYKYKVPFEEIKSISLYSIYKALKTCENDKTFEQYVWKIIRNDILTYVNKKKKSASIFKNYLPLNTDDEQNEVIDIVDKMDFIYKYDANRMRHFEILHDVEKIFASLSGMLWKFSNMLFLFGADSNLLCKHLNISKSEYHSNMRLLRLKFKFAGYD
jgi:DNA-directed RNA polymerase specialized sigma24 family protein